MRGEDVLTEGLRPGRRHIASWGLCGIVPGPHDLADEFLRHDASFTSINRLLTPPGLTITPRHYPPSF